MQRLRKERDHFASATRKEIETLPDGITVRSKTVFASPTTLQLDDGRKVTAKAMVIATGATPSIPDGFDAIRDLILTNETVFEIEALPKSLAVIGAGPLGLELGQAMARLSVAATVLDKSETIGGVEDQAVAEQLKSVLGREFAIHLGVEIEADWSMARHV